MTNDSFLNDGIVKTMVTNREDYLEQIIQQPDGKLLVVGSSNVLDQSKAVLVRYLSTGEIDSSFGSAGIVTLNSFPFSRGQAISVDLSGNIFLAGEFFAGRDTASKLFVAKFNSVGGIQSSFGDSGLKILSVDTPFSHSVAGISLLDTGELLVTGDSVDSVLTFKLNSNGQLISSFGQSGISQTKNMQFLDINDSVSTLDNGLILVGSQRSSNDIFIVKLTASGALDSNFDGDGILSYSFPSQFGALQRTRGEASSVVVESDGDFFIAGTNAETVNDNTPNLVIGKFKPSGVLDSSFGNQGFFSIDRSSLPSNYNRATFTDISLTSSGGLLASGHVTGSSVNSFVVKLDQSGKLVQDFGNKGILLIGSSSFERIESLVVTPSSKVLVAGTAVGEPVGNILYSDFYLGALTASGSFDFIQMAVNTIKGSIGNDRIASTSSNDSIDGGSGVDTVSYLKSKSEVSFVKKSSGALEVTGDGIDTLENVERLKFSDVSVAFDLSGNAGKVAKLIGAVFGSGFVSNKEYVGVGLSLIDSGMSYEGLMEFALDFKLGKNVSNSDLVKNLYMNVVGSQPTDVEVRDFVTLIENGTFTKNSLGIFAAENELNQDRIDLVGLSNTGIEYF